MELFAATGFERTPLRFTLRSCARLVAYFRVGTPLAFVGLEELIAPRAFL